MKKILIIGYTHEDLPFIVHLDTLCEELKKKNFSIAVDKEEHEFDLEEKINHHQARIDQMADIARKTFDASLEDLKLGRHPKHKDIPSSDTNAFKSLARRTRSISFHKAILTSLQNNQVTHFYGTGEEIDAALIDNIYSYQTDHIAVLIEKERMIPLRDALKSPTTLIETFFLTSASYQLTEETKEFMQSSKILISSVVGKKEHPHSISSIIHKALESLNERMRLFVSAKAARKEYYPHHSSFHRKVSTPTIADSETKNASTMSIAEKMKRALKGIFDDDVGSSPNIVGRDGRNRSSDDD